MTSWQPYSEPLKATLTRTLGIAIVVGAIFAMVSHDMRHWPSVSLLALWPSFGGHWVEMLFLNVIRPRLPNARGVQTIARIAVWFAGGAIMALGVLLTARTLNMRLPLARLTWATGGAAFVAIELITHGLLGIRASSSFYTGRGQ